MNINIAFVLSYFILNTVANNQYLLPEQVHIAYGENVKDIVVTWSTLNDTQETLLKYGEQTPSKQVTGTSHVFIDEGRLQWRQWIHRVTLKDLKINTKYYYMVGSKHGWSKKFSFITPESEENFAVNAIIFGDLGYENNKSMPFLIEDMERNRYDVILHVGDIAYDMHEQNGMKGNLYMNMVEPIAAKVPYMIVPGNHESAYNFSHVKNRFSMPGPYESMYHSFDLGLVHFVGINTEAYYDDILYPNLNTTDFGQMITHYNWLKNDLEEANRPENRQKRPWIVVYGHKPFYCSNEDDDCVNFFRAHRGGFQGLGGLEEMFADAGVDLAIYAHEHTYERLWPVYNNKIYNGSYENPYVNPGALVQIISGDAGDRELQRGFVKKPQPWSAFRSREYGYMRFHCPNRTHLYIEQVAVAPAPPLSQNSKSYPNIMDSIWLVRDHHESYTYS